MKNSRIALLGGCLIVSILAGCQGISVEPGQDSIVGVWRLEEVRLSGRILTPEEWGFKISFIFRQNGSFTKSTNVENSCFIERGSYSVTNCGDEFMLYLKPSGDSYNCWITGETLMMYEGEYLGVPTLVFNKWLNP